jgi:hypothetical protein
MWIGGCEGYGLRSGLARKDRIGLNIVRPGKIGVKGLFLEYGEYSDEYSPTQCTDSPGFTLEYRIKT